MRVLIVDDSELIRERLSESLSELDAIKVIDRAANISETVKSISLAQPDAVILDIRLAGESGIDILKWIKNDKPSTVVIMFTAYPFPRYREECMKSGADFFFDKADEFGKVVDACRKLTEATPRRESAG